VLNINFVLCMVLTCIYFLACSIYNTYWSSWIWVVRDFTENQWTYVCETATASLCVFSLVAGLGDRYTNRFKIMLIAGCCTTIIGMGVCYYSATHPTTWSFHKCSSRAALHLL
jgi:cyanate permease